MVSQVTDTGSQPARKAPVIPRLDLSKAPHYEDSETSELYKVAQRINTESFDPSLLTASKLDSSSETNESMLEFLANEEKESHEDKEIYPSLCSSAVKRERQHFLEAFKIEEVWAEMERIKASKQQMDQLYQKTANYQL
jgi:hypothetical protein